MIKIIIAILLSVFITTQAKLDICYSNGDPHYRLFNGKKTHFQQIGDFVLAKTKYLTVHSRTKQWGKTRTSVNIATGVLVGGVRLVFQDTLNNKVLVNGKAETLKAGKNVFKGVTVDRYGSKVYVKRNGEYVTIQANRRSHNRFFQNVAVYGEAREGGRGGLCSGNVANAYGIFNNNRPCKPPVVKSTVCTKSEHKRAVRHCNRRFRGWKGRFYRWCVYDVCRGLRAKWKRKFANQMRYWKRVMAKYERYRKINARQAKKFLRISLKHLERMRAHGRLYRKHSRLLRKLRAAKKKNLKLIHHTRRQRFIHLRKRHRAYVRRNHARRQHHRFLHLARLWLRRINFVRRSINKCRRNIRVQKRRLAVFIKKYRYCKRKANNHKRAARIHHRRAKFHHNAAVRHSRKLHRLHKRHGRLHKAIVRKYRKVRKHLHLRNYHYRLRRHNLIRKRQAGNRARYWRSRKKRVRVRLRKLRKEKRKRKKNSIRVWTATKVTKSKTKSKKHCKSKSKVKPTESPTKSVTKSKSKPKPTTPAPTTPAPTTPAPTTPAPTHQVPTTLAPTQGPLVCDASAQEVTNTEWEAEYLNSVYDEVSDTTKFTYSVTVQPANYCLETLRDRHDGKACKDLSHFTIGINIPKELWGQFFVSASSQNTAFGCDPTTGVYGFKYDDGQSTGTVKEYWFKLKGKFNTGPGLYAVKGGKDFEKGTGAFQVPVLGGNTLVDSNTLDEFENEEEVAEEEIEW